MHKYPRRLVRLAGWLAALTLSGCYVPTPNPPAAATALSLNRPRPGPRGVSVSGRLVYSADQTRPPIDRLIERARESLAGGGPQLGQIVQRWPDVTLEALRQGPSTDADVPLWLAIAQTYDRIFATQDDSAGWRAALAALASQAPRYQAFRQTRGQMLALFQDGQFERAAKLNADATLPSDAPPALRVEALRLNGLASLLNDNPAGAADLFSRAGTAAANGSRHVQFEIALLQSESLRRANRADVATRVWQFAANVATAGDVRDPDLWERAILTKPAAANWPAAAVLVSDDEPGFDRDNGPELADVLLDVGIMRLARGAPQPALLAFSRAESESSVPAKRSLARLYRVQSMIELQQSASALTMLEELIQSGNPRIARRAQAIQGDVLCRDLEDRKHGIPLMREAIDAPGAGEWPGKNQLAANLGLYLLIEGDDEEGLRRLHAAEARFQADGQWEDLACDLKDEAAYLRNCGKAAQAEQLQRRADDVCRTAGLPIGPFAARDDVSRLDGAGGQK